MLLGKYLGASLPSNSIGVYCLLGENWGGGAQGAHLGNDAYKKIKETGECCPLHSSTL